MNERLMILPSHTLENIRLLRIPDDYEEQEAYRFVTGLIAGVEEDAPDCSWDDIADVLEERDFVQVGFVRGPVLK